MKEPRVREIIKIYEKGNIIKVQEYFNQPDMIVDPSTWAGRLKDHIEKEQFFTAKAQIETIAYKFIKI